MVLLVSLGAVDPPQVAGVTSLQDQIHTYMRVKPRGQRTPRVCQHDAVHLEDEAYRTRLVLYQSVMSHQYMRPDLRIWAIYHKFSNSHY